METSVEKKGIDNIIKLFSFLYVLLTSSGVAYNFILYKQYGLTITQYIDTSEIFLLFIPLVTDIPVIMLSLTSCIFFMTKPFLFPETKDLKLIWKAKRERKQFLQVCIFAWVFVIIFLSLAEFNLFKYYGAYLLLVSAITLFGPLSLEFLFNFFDKNLKIKVPVFFRNALYVFIVFLSISLFKGFSTAERIFRIAKFEKVEIIFRNGEPTFNNDSSHFYLGRTRNYLFIYNSIYKTTRVVNAIDVKEFISTKEY